MVKEEKNDYIVISELSFINCFFLFMFFPLRHKCGLIDTFKKE